MMETFETNKIERLKNLMKENIETLRHIPEAKDELEYCKDMLMILKNGNHECLITFKRWKLIGEAGALLGTGILLNPNNPQKGTIMEHNKVKPTEFQQKIIDIVNKHKEAVKNRIINVNEFEKKVQEDVKTIMVSELKNDKNFSKALGRKLW